ncbi:MAG: sigma-54 dependent transcriptional regulator [Gemmatimonadales bacterium]|nr:sigma-54 dependent transcriptional regulator [Gemmatimonadales bacterium]
MEKVRVIVVRLSDAFAELWEQLARDLGAEIWEHPRTDPCMSPPDVAAVLLAAGGAEQEARDWLDRHSATCEAPIFAVGADPGRRIAAQVVARGARDYFALPEDVEILRNAVGSAVTRQRETLRRAARAAAPMDAEVFAAMVGESPALKGVLARTTRILAHPDATALIVGETGTGKELLARAIHQGSPRRTRPFVAVNCSALPEHLVESELFGHERGAFTDAHAAKPGLFEVADGGTLFLDEIGTFPVALQGKLLRALEDKQVRRVGGVRPHTVDVRIIAASNEDLAGAVRAGRFRSDLYYRLSVIVLALPPLRERGRDVLLIAEALLKGLAKQHGLPEPALRRETCDALLGHHWPGNVRELKNALERGLLLSPPGVLELDELVPEAGPASPAPGGLIPFPAPLEVITRAAVHAMLDSCGGNRSEAARRLRISRRRLRRLLSGETGGT